jgi:hypothetical protein
VSPPTETHQSRLCVSVFQTVTGPVIHTPTRGARSTITSYSTPSGALVRLTRLTTGRIMLHGLALRL